MGNKSLVGKQFGYLTVLEELLETDYRNQRQWKCKCICGEVVVKTTVLLNRAPKNYLCGHCKWHIKYPEAYSTWKNLRARCTNPATNGYKYYGGRGITYDPKWDEFVVFFLDMGNPPCDTITGARCTLDRIDNNGNYTKENCQWATKYAQESKKYV